MYRREELSLYKIKELEQLLVPEKEQLHKNRVKSDHESGQSVKLMEVFRSQPPNLKFFRSAFNCSYSPMRMVGEPEIQHSRFLEDNEQKALYYEISFEQLNTVFPKEFQVPSELLLDPLNKKTKIIYQVINNDYKFVQLCTAPKFKTVMDSYLHEDKYLALSILEKAEVLNEINLTEVRVHLWNNMASWHFPYQQSNGLHDIDYQKTMRKITRHLPAEIKLIIKQVYLLDNFLRQNYDLSNKSKGKKNSRWDDDAYNEELAKVLPNNLSLINPERTSKLLALFACFDDGIGIERPTAVIAALSPLSKFATAVANQRREALYEFVRGLDDVIIDKKSLQEKSERLIQDDINLETELFNQLNASRDVLFASLKF